MDMEEFQYKLKQHLEYGNISAERGDEKEALNHYLDGLNIAKEMNDSNHIKLFSNLAITLM